MTNGAEYRIEEIIDLYQQVNPDKEVTAATTINNTSIARLCETDGGPYKRIRAWLLKQLEKNTPVKLEVKFSGQKDTYENGATRDSRKGKGRYDLISPLFLKRLAKVLEAGAENHGDNNWKGGIQYSRLIDSALRHISQYNEGLKDEDHLAQATCNLMFLIHFEEEGRTELNDLNINK